jgi:protease I
MQLPRKRIAILAENLYEDLELWYPALRFREALAEAPMLSSAHRDAARQWRVLLAMLS